MEGGGRFPFKEKKGQFYGCPRGELGMCVRHWPTLPGGVLSSIPMPLRAAAEVSFRWRQFWCPQQDRRGPGSPQWTVEGLPGNKRVEQSLTSKVWCQDYIAVTKGARGSSAPLTEALPFLALWFYGFTEQTYPASNAET